VSIIIELADVIVAELRAEPLQIDAVRAYRPEFELPELQTLRVSVVPRGIEITSSNRSLNRHDISIDVGVQKKVDADDSTALDSLMMLVQRIADQLRIKRLNLPGGGGAVWSKTANDPIYSPEHLQTKNVFTSVLTFTFCVVR